MNMKYLEKLNEITKSEMLAISTVFIGLIGLIIVLNDYKIFGNMVIWFACGMLFTVYYIDKIQKSKEK